MTAEVGQSRGREQRRDPRIALNEEQANAVQVLPSTMKQLYHFMQTYAPAMTEVSFAAAVQAVFEEGSAGWLPDFIVTDLSAGGACLACPEQLPVGTALQLRLQTPGTKELIETRGEVVRVAPSPASIAGQAGLVYQHGVKFEGVSRRPAVRVLEALRSRFSL